MQFFEQLDAQSPDKNVQPLAHSLMCNTSSPKLIYYNFPMCYILAQARTNNLMCRTSNLLVWQSHSSRSNILMMDQRNVAYDKQSLRLAFTFCLVFFLLPCFVRPPPPQKCSNTSPGLPATTGIVLLEPLFPQVCVGFASVAELQPSVQLQENLLFNLSALLVLSVSWRCSRLAAKCLCQAGITVLPEPKLQFQKTLLYMQPGIFSA